MLAKRRAEGGELAPGGPVQQLAPPPAQREADRAAHAAVHAHERGACLLHDPVEHRLRHRPPQLGRGREGVEDVPERGEAHEEDSCHLTARIALRRR
jgi:hypothetical protein